TTPTRTPTPRRPRTMVTRRPLRRTTRHPRAISISGKSLPTCSTMSQTTTSPSCPWMGPHSMTTTSTARPNARHEALLCRYVLLDCLVQPQRPVARACRGVRCDPGRHGPLVHDGRGLHRVPRLLQSGDTTTPHADGPVCPGPAGHPRPHGLPANPDGLSPGPGPLPGSAG